MTYGRSYIDEVRSQSRMLKLKAHHGYWGPMTFVLDEHGVRGSHQRSFLGFSIEGHWEYEALWFDGVLVHSALVPHLVDGSAICFTEVAANDREKKVKEPAAKAKLKGILESTYGIVVSGGKFPWSCHLRRPLRVAMNDVVTPNIWYPCLHAIISHSLVFIRNLYDF